MIRVIVLKEVPNAEHNLLWQLFSAQQEKVQDAARQYFESGSEINTVINQLLAKYQAEGINMPYTLEDFRKEYVRSGLNLLTPEEVLTQYEPEQRLAGLAPKERLVGLAPEERLVGLAPEERLVGLAPEEVLTQYEPEQRLAGLAPEERLARLSAKDRKWLAEVLAKEQSGGSQAPDKA